MAFSGSGSPDMFTSVAQERSKSPIVAFPKERTMSNCTSMKDISKNEHHAGGKALLPAFDSDVELQRASRLGISIAAQHPGRPDPIHTVLWGRLREVLMCASSAAAT